MNSESISHGNKSPNNKSTRKNNEQARSVGKNGGKNGEHNHTNKRGSKKINMFHFDGAPDAEMVDQSDNPTDNSQTIEVKPLFFMKAL